MPKSEREPLETVTIRLYKGDRKRLQEIWGDTIGYNVAIRRLVRKYIRSIEARAQKELDKIPEPAVDIDLSQE